jgi:hypothetical protein
MGGVATDCAGYGLGRTLAGMLTAGLDTRSVATGCVGHKRAGHGLGLSRAVLMGDVLATSSAGRGLGWPWA